MTTILGSSVAGTSSPSAAVAGTTTLPAVIVNAPRHASTPAVTARASSPSASSVHHSRPILARTSRRRSAGEGWGLSAVMPDGGRGGWSRCIAASLSLGFMSDLPSCGPSPCASRQQGLCCSLPFDSYPMFSRPAAGVKSEVGFRLILHWTDDCRRPFSFATECTAGVHPNHPCRHIDAKSIDMRHGHMNGDAEDDGVRGQAHEAQCQPRDDRRQRFGQRLAEMDHAVRDRHHDDGVGAETAAQAVDQKAAERNFTPTNCKPYAISQRQKSGHNGTPRGAGRTGRFPGSAGWRRRSRRAAPPRRASPDRPSRRRRRRAV